VSKNLKNTIDKMVEDSIRRILPGVMNEILVKTLANSGVLQERKSVDKPAYPYIPDNGGKRIKPVQNGSRRLSSLNDILDETAGSDFYNDPRAAMTEATRDEEPQIPRGQLLAQRIQGLSPELQKLAEGMDLDEDGGEMWDDSDSIVPIAENGPPLDRAARAVGLDFSRMRQVANITESKKKSLAADDRAANAQFETLRLKRMREKLNDGKPIE
jgi:hypothetical protein